MKNTICPDCEGDDFHPCADCYKSMSDSEVKTELAGRGIYPSESYWKMRAELWEMRFRQAESDLKDQKEVVAVQTAVIRRLDANIERLESRVTT